ncbi:hypothetical protein [Nonomuraea fuscirosea]|uniref:hypothetical protein n=1 Tax=Nonomuraea fuscirosea TaxID=1291556 RepID=UPI00343F20A7
MDLPSKIYGCTRGDFCVYSTEVISAGTKIGIGRGEDWAVSSASASPYKGVRSFFNYGWPDYEDHVAVTFVWPDSTKSRWCIHRAEDGDLGEGHTTVSTGVTVIKIDWINASQAPCNE